MTDIHRTGRGGNLLTARFSRAIPDERKPASNQQRDDVVRQPLRLPFPAAPYAVGQLQLQGQRPRTTVMSETEFKAKAVEALPTAERAIATKFGKFLEPGPKIQLRFLTAQEMEDSGSSKTASAAVNNNEPSTLKVNKDDFITRTAPPSQRAWMMVGTLAHEALHLKSVPFATDLANEYGKPKPDGTARRFMDGTPLRGVVEGLTERFAMEALNHAQPKSAYFKPYPYAYKNEQKWADRLIQQVGIELVQQAYFRNDPGSKKKVMDALDSMEAGVDRAELDRRIKERNPPPPITGY
jgi:hypothetical protein